MPSFTIRLPTIASFSWREKLAPLLRCLRGLQDDRAKNSILPELNAIQQNGLIRVVDLLFVSKNADGAIQVQEVSEVSEEEQPV